MDKVHPGNGPRTDGVDSPYKVGAAQISSSAGFQVMIPVLPRANEIASFINEIDQTHIYSNNGPLNQRFCHEFASLIEERLTRPATPSVTTVANGTVAIDLALRASGLRERAHVMMPSYTFIATAHAVLNAGYTPYFVDVDEETLTLTPAIAEQALQDGLKPAAIVVVSPFGGPVDIPSWEIFESTTGVPVVFDMAAAVTNIRYVGRQPICISLHATKMLGLGEGGAVISSDSALVNRIQMMTSFGFEGGRRESVLQGGNFRVSEYAAAVGLASIRDLSRKIAVLEDRAAFYNDQLSGTDVTTQCGFGSDWIAMSMNLILPSNRVERILAQFDYRGIQWRRWWSYGCHTHSVFRSVPRSELPITERVAFRTIGVPFHEFVTNEDIKEICSIVA